MPLAELTVSQIQAIFTARSRNLGTDHDGEPGAHPGGAGRRGNEGGPTGLAASGPPAPTLPAALSAAAAARRTSAAGCVSRPLVLVFWLAVI
jgi:hypothetical protein